MFIPKKLFFAASSLILVASAQAADIVVPMNLVDENGIGKEIGQVTISDSPYGVVLTPALTGLPPGLHGFHMHENGKCDAVEKDGKKVAALAAGGHYDPLATKKHGTPWGEGHYGDLPPLFFDSNGNGNQPVFAPRFQWAKQFSGRALIVHAGGDNHSDTPAPLGGGGGRSSCGVIP